MSNLTDLLPAGAGGKQVSFVASGTIGDGVTVALKTDGTVSAISSTTITENLGSSGTFDTNSVYNIASVYDSVSNKIIVAYRDAGSSFYGKIVVGTISSTTISFGSSVSLAGAEETNPISLAYDANAQKVLACYKASSNNYGYAVVCTVSGNSITVATPTVFHSGSISQGLSAQYSPVDQKTVIAYYGNSGLGTAVVASISGNTVSFGSASQFSSAAIEKVSACYDSTIQKVILAYSYDPSAPKGASIVCTVSGTSISFGSEAVFNTSGINVSSLISNVYDSGSNKSIIFYVGASNYPRYVVAEVSGTSITYGAETIIRSSSTLENAASYNSAANKTVYVWRDPANSNYGKVQVGTLSGTTLSFTTALTYNAGTTSYPNAVYDSAAEKTAIIYADDSNSDGVAKVYTTGYVETNFADFIGISDAAISDTASGSVTIKGGISTNVTGLTANLTYYVQDNGTLATTTSSVLAGKALSSTSINLDYTT